MSTSSRSIWTRIPCGSDCVALQEASQPNKSPTTSTLLTSHLPRQHISHLPNDTLSTTLLTPLQQDLLDINIRHSRHTSHLTTYRHHITSHDKHTLNTQHSTLSKATWRPSSSKLVSWTRHRIDLDKGTHVSLGERMGSLKTCTYKTLASRAAGCEYSFPLTPGKRKLNESFAVCNVGSSSSSSLLEYGSSA